MSSPRDQQDEDARIQAAGSLLLLASGDNQQQTTNSAGGDSPLPPRDSMNDQYGRERAESASALIDPPQVPNGRGEYHWLDPEVDQPRAAALQIDSPLSMIEARENGQLDPTIPADRLPIVVFYPTLRFLNPERRPDIPGRFEYLTTGEGYAENYAHVQLGGQPGPLEDIPYPTAEHVFYYRRQLRRHIEEGADIVDVTEDIDLVFVPEAGWDTPPNSASPSPSEFGSDDSEVDPEEIDGLTGLEHEPLNRGENDQTGIEGQRCLQTRFIHGKKYTVDRSRVHVNDEQQHKYWVVTKKGGWKKWPKYNKLDWTDKAAVERLNKWREQEFGRNQWPPKRPTKRPDYTQEQREWVFDFVKETGGDRPKPSIKELCRRFNERYNPQPRRNDAGIQGLVDRLREEFRKHGKLLPKKGRGTKRKRDDDEGGDEGEDSGED